MSARLVFVDQHCIENATSFLFPIFGANAFVLAQTRVPICIKRFPDRSSSVPPQVSTTKAFQS
jgi:hypothetical protein